MKVNHDFTITEADIIVCALKEYSELLKRFGNNPRAALAETLVNLF